jgi:acetyl-CoA acetyltransferase
MVQTPRTAAVISGVGISQIGRRTGIAALDLTVQAAREAITDAGLRANDIDAILTLGDTPAAVTASALGAQSETFGGGFGHQGLLSPLAQACEMVDRKQARHILVYRNVQMMGGTVPSRPAGKSSSATRRRATEIDYFLAAHAYSAANWVAMLCQRHMQIYGTTREQLGWVAINARCNASRNPLAVYREPMSMDEYLAARPISTPLALLDCDVPVDGAIALVVSTEAHRGDSPHGAVTVEAIGGASGAGGWTQRTDYPNMAASEAAKEMWASTDLQPPDVDVAQLYDGFTFLTLAWLEALGFCGKGESGPFVEGGQRISPDGQLPLNTYGGQLSAGRLHGYWVLYEACQQLRGRAEHTALPRRPEVAVAAAGGGPIAGCVLLSC